MGGDLMYVEVSEHESTRVHTDSGASFNFLKSGAYELRVAARRQNIRDELATYGIKTVGLDFQDAEGLSTEVAKHDVGSHKSASADDSDRDQCGSL